MRGFFISALIRVWFYCPHNVLNMEGGYTTLGG